MQFIDLAHQQKIIKPLIDERMQAVLAHGQYINGPEVRELEEKLAQYAGVSHAVGCASGTDALLMALMACGIGPGDAVFTTPFTFIATAEVISLLGATPVFVDIDPDTFNIDPGRLESAVSALVERNPAIHPLPANNSVPLRPRCIITVNLFGLPADHAAVNALAKKHGLFVIEDAAQSFGAESNGSRSCSLADIGCTSFFPAKPLGCYGDGGMCFTDSGELAEIIQSVRVHGKGAHKYDNVRIGINGRLDTLQAAVVLARFTLFPREIELRQAVAARYAKSLAPLSVNGRGPLKLPSVPGGMRSAWAQYSLLAPDSARRSTLQQALKKDGIPTQVYYPTPLHLQTAFGPLGYGPGDFPVSEDCASRIFSLPMHPYLQPEDQDFIADSLARACRL